MTLHFFISGTSERAPASLCSTSSRKISWKGARDTPSMPRFFEAAADLIERAATAFGEGMRRARLFVLATNFLGADIHRTV